MKISKNILFTYDKKILREVDIFIITVPIPINNEKLLDLELIKKPQNLLRSTKYRNNRSKSTNKEFIALLSGLTEEFASQFWNQTLFGI